MTSAPALAPAPVEWRPAPLDPKLTHLFCCDPDLSLCGLDLSLTPYGMSPGEEQCVVCVDLEDAVCPRCGS